MFSGEPISNGPESPRAIVLGYNKQFGSPDDRNTFALDEMGLSTRLHQSVASGPDIVDHCQDGRWTPEIFRFFDRLPAV